MTETPLLKAAGIKVEFGGTVALDGVDLQVGPGEVLALMGENGAGKSTLMKVLSGALTADHGRMWLNGQPYQPRNPHDARLQGVAMIYQELSLAPQLSVAENIFLGMEPGRFGWLAPASMKARASATLAELGHQLAADAKVSTLSISDQQMVEIARAKTLGCKLLILDEPTSSISENDVKRLFQLIKEMKEQGHGIIYISHFIDEVKAIADKITIIRDGKTVADGTSQHYSNDQIVALMIGRDLRDLYPRSSRTCGEALLEIENLSGFSRLRKASLTVHRGEVLGVFGLVGSGRTDLLRAIFGLDQVRSGKVKVGAWSGYFQPAERWQQGAGMISEDRQGEGLALSRTIAENLILSNPASVEQNGLLVPKKITQISNHFIGKLNVRCRGVDQSVRELSGGNQQKIALARLLHHDCDLLLLDEPTRGIDVGSKRLIYELVDELTRNGKAVLLVSSYLPELLGVSDRIAVMNRGRLSAARPVAEFSEHEIMTAATEEQEESTNT